MNRKKNEQKESIIRGTAARRSLLGERTEEI